MRQHVKPPRWPNGC